MPVRRITPHDLSAMLAHGQPPLILDVRTEGERASFGWIDGSVHLEQRDILPFLQKSSPGPATLIVTVCQTGARSAVAASALADAGFTNVCDLSGGMLGWMLLRLPLRR